MGRLRLLVPALVALVVLAGLVWMAQQSQPGPETRPTVVPAVGPAPVGGDFEASATVQKNFDVTGAVQLEFRGFNGSLSIKPGAPGKLEITAIKTSSGPDDATARRQVKEMPLVISQEKDRVVFDATTGGVPWDTQGVGHINYILIAPEQSGVAIADGSGSLKISGIHLGVKVTGGELPVRLTNVGGGVSVAIKSGNITVDSAGGEVALSTAEGNISLKHISAASLAVDASGTVSIVQSSATGPLTLTTQGTNVTMTQTGAGQMDISAPRATVQLKQVSATKALRVDSGELGVWVNQSQAHPLAITTKKANVQMTEVQGDIEVTTGGGQLSLANATPSSLSVNSGGGTVSFTGSLPKAGATKIDTGGGALYVTVARETAFALDADAGTGKLSVDRLLLAGQTLSGAAAKTRINGGGPQVQLRTRGGFLGIDTH
jgi:DUF4097 and DUF4098 domain-containing protein YvlB